MAYERTEEVEFDPFKEEAIKIYAGMSDDNMPFVQLIIGEKITFLPCSVALHVGLTLQQLAYTAMFMAQAKEIARNFVTEESLNEYQESLVKAIMGSVDDETK